MQQWLEILKTAAELHGRRYVEERLGISKTTLSQVLNEKYPGNLDNIARRVTEQFGTDLNTVIVCPVLAEITRERCLIEQQKPFIATNPTRVKLWQMCRNCPNKCRSTK